MRKKLKVVFRGEEGVDEGGVAKEFFQLLTVQVGVVVLMRRIHLMIHVRIRITLHVR